MTGYRSEGIGSLLRPDYLGASPIPGYRMTTSASTSSETSTPSLSARD